MSSSFSLQIHFAKYKLELGRRWSVSDSRLFGKFIRKLARKTECKINLKGLDYLGKFVVPI